MIFFFPYTLTLKAPVVITDFGGDPNSASTRPFIPGSALRGAVAAILGDPTNRSEQDAARFKRLITSGEVCYLNAYPSTPFGQRSIPKPVSLRTEKYASHVSDKYTIDLSSFEFDDWPEEQLTGVDVPFVYYDPDGVHTVPVSFSARTHHQRDRKKGRATKERGAIFTYESLNPEQTFMGYVTVSAADEKAAEKSVVEIRDLLRDQVFLGRSRLAGYGGKAGFELFGVPKTREYQGKEVWDKNLVQGDEFRVILLSDYIGRDPVTGQVDPASFIPHLLNALDYSAEIIRIRWNFGLAGGFSRKARLPLPLTSTLAAGSVITLKANQNISQERLVAVEAIGLGERRTEGFGRFSFWQAGAKHRIKLKIFEIPTVEEPEQIKGRDSQNLLRMMQRRLLLNELESTILVVAKSYVTGIKAPPNTSLIGRIRAPLQNNPQEALNTLVEWTSLSDSDKNQHRNHLAEPAVKQLRRCRLRVKGQPTLFDWLQNMARKDNIAEQLDFAQLRNTYYLLSESDAQDLLENQKEVLRVRLIDAVLSEIGRYVREHQKGGQTRAQN